MRTTLSLPLILRVAVSSNQWRSVAQYSPDYTGQRSWSRSGGLQLETSTTARSCPTSPSPSVAPVIRCSWLMTMSYRDCAKDTVLSVGPPLTLYSCYVCM
ncbi:hypothetical protein GBAR_LOCUS27953 [Geodia barretti]|uniref:Uncharacterized protein n=1 Tax=Geodia barretti TaxID=519541 RepID=A0AA35XHG8_GEOBA|nr:hypothetical protein GBAR_LOCUS27953 [Geodia barretti]